MSRAFPIQQLRVRAVVGMNGQHVQVGSLWLTGNLLFRADGPGSAMREGLSQWAQAVDETGRGYLLWVAAHPRAQGLVVQPLDSEYCYEVFPA